MPVLVSLGAASWWQFALSAAISVACTVGVARAAIAVYRASILQAGAGSRSANCSPAEDPAGWRRIPWQRFSTGPVDKGVRHAGAPVVKGGDYLCKSGDEGAAELRGVLCISIRFCG